MVTPSGSSRMRSSLSPEVLDFVVRFDSWIFDEFRRALNTSVLGPSIPAELTLLLLPWVEELRNLGARGLLRGITPEVAERLACLMNHALDGLGKEYQRCQASPAVMLLALSPIDDILVFLSLTNGSSPN